MEKLKQIPAAPKRLICFLLALICMLGLLPNTAFAAGPNTIVMEDCTHNGVYYESAALSTCWLHQMKFDFNGDTVMGFCADHGGGMGWSLEGHEWNNPREITDPTVKTMMAYFYAHSRGIFTDQAKALGVDETWSSDYTWTMNAWVQAVVWRYQENLFSDPVAACAEELMYVYNNLEHTSYSSIDDVVDGTTLRDRAQYILDLGAQGVWGDCTVYEYDYAGPGTAQHPAYDVQGIIIGDLTVTRERYQFTIKKVDATNPNLALPGARFLVQNANGTFEKEVVTGRDGTVTLTNLEASTYSVTELDPPEDYQIDNPGPQYVVLPDSNGETVVVTFTDTPIITSEGSIRKVDADDPTKGLAGAVIKIEGVDNEFTGTYITGAGGYLEDVPWDATQTVVITNSKAGSLIIDKRDSLTGEPLEGVTFKVTTSTGEYVPDENGYISSNGLYKTDKDGKIQIDGVVGTLVVTETATIPGYSIDPATQIQTVQVNPNDTQTLTFYNTPSTTLVIEKYIEGTTTPLEGVTFLVTDSSGAVVGPSNGEYITDENGRIVIDDLEPGTTITAREVKTLEGYVLDTAPKSIEIKSGEVQTLRFYNSKQGTLVIRKLDSVTKEPLAGVEFELTYADGGYVDDANGHLSSLGLYTTDQNGEIRISGVTGTIVVKETKTISGYTIDPATQTQTVEVNPEDTQTLTFYNNPVGGVEILKVDANRTSKRIPNTTFEIRKIDDELIDTITTDKNGRAYLSLEDGAYYAVEIEAGEGYRLDDTPRYFEVEDGKTTTIRIENEAFSGLLIHKVDATTGEGIYGVHFLVYDSNRNPIGEYVSDDRGYVYVEDLTSGRYYVRELENEGYLVDDELKTVYIRDGATTEIEWENTPITAQIQIWKKSADDNAINGFPAGTPLEGAVFEIYNKANALVDTIESDSRGLAVSKPLPLGRYIVKEVSSPQYYSVSDEEVTVYLEHEGQIVQIEFLNESVYTNVSINKSGYTEVVPGQEVRYTFKDIGNNSTVPLDSFYWRDTLPTDAVRLDKIITGTYSTRLNYKVVFQTNLSNTQRVLADNLNTLQNYTLDASPAALGLASNEYVTQVTFLFGRVPGGFRQVETPYIYCDVLSSLPHEYRFSNKCDVGGMWQNQWIQATDRWVTIIYRGGPVPTLPRTGY